MRKSSTKNPKTAVHPSADAEKSNAAKQTRGTLYLVPTPIGNLSDMTFRAVEVLKSVAIIACEDTRTSRVLLQHYGIATPCISYHTHNEAKSIEALVTRLAGGASLALISDAGTPLISDPGARLVSAAIAADIPVVPLPGACAIPTALAGSGLGGGSFFFGGFVPTPTGEREAFLRDMLCKPCAVILYETPHRLRASVAALATIEPTRHMVLAGELSKRFERWVRGDASDVLTQLGAGEIKGEWVMVLAPAAAEAQSSDALVDAMLEEALNRLSAPKAAAEVARATHRPRAEVYQRILALKHGKHPTP